MYRPMNEILSNEKIQLLYQISWLIFMISCVYIYIGYIFHDTTMTDFMFPIIIMSGLSIVGLHLHLAARKLK